MSLAGPVPGYSGHPWIDANSTWSVPWKMSFVPLPWWTSQSTMSTRCSPWTSSARCAAIAMFANRQNPMARSRSAWWPGGRCAEAAAGGPPPPSRGATTAHAPATAEQEVDGVARAAHAVARRRPGPGADHRVEIDLPAAVTAELLDERHVL